MSKQLFVTGATGYIGPALIEAAVSNGYTVRGLSRSEAGDTKVIKAGGTPVRGDLTSLDVLREEAEKADAIIHLATSYEFGKPDYDVYLPIDSAAADALVEGIQGTDKPLIATSGTLIYAADPSGKETNENSPHEANPILTRSKFDGYVLGLAKTKGVNVKLVRLAPFVYGRGGSGVARFMAMAAQTGSLITVDGAKHYTTTVHVDDAVQLYLLTLTKGKAGEIFNASSSTDVKAHDLIEAMARAVGVPLTDITHDEAGKQYGPIVAWFLKAENRASGDKARMELGWEPKEVGILEDINKGSYQVVAEQLKKRA